MRNPGPFHVRRHFQRPRHYGVRAGFTLVELLVSMVVLLLIFAVAASLTFSSQNLLSHGMEKMDADGQARLVFDQMTTDLALMLKRTDIDYIVKDSAQVQAGNDSMAFFANAQGYFSASPNAAPRNAVSLIGYRVNGQTYQMERLAKGTGWSSASMVFLPGTLFGTWPSIAGAGGAVPNLNQGTDADYQVLADGVFRFEYCYILRDGTMSNVPHLASNTATNTDTALNGWQDVVSIYAAVAVLDDRSRVLVPGAATNTPALGSAALVFGDFSFGNGQALPPLAQWEAKLEQANFATQANLPAKAAAAVRIFARAIPVNIFPPDPSL